MEGFDSETYPSEVGAQIEAIEQVLNGPWAVRFPSFTFSGILSKRQTLFSVINLHPYHAFLLTIVGFWPRCQQSSYILGQEP